MNKQFSEALRQAAAQASKVEPIAATSNWSNQQIAAAAVKAYENAWEIVDPCSEGLFAMFRDDPDGLVRQFNAQGWTESSLTPAQIAAGGQFYEKAKRSPLFPIDRAATLSLTTLGFAVTAKLQFIVGAEGGIGCVWDTLNRQGPKGLAYGCGKLGIEFGIGTSIQFVALNELAQGVEGLFYGVAAAAGPVSLIVFLEPKALKFRGFTIGAGVQFGLGVSVVAGGMKSFG